MRPFTIVAPLSRATYQEVELVLSAGLKFLLSLPKKQRHSARLVLLDNGELPAHQLEMLNSQRALNSIDVVIHPEANGQASIVRQSDLMFLPRQRYRMKWVRMALSQGLPVVTFDSPNRSNLFDETCAMLIPVQPREKSIVAFANIFRMLFFDPGAQMALKRGISRKYDTPPVQSGSGLILTSAA